MLIADSFPASRSSSSYRMRLRSTRRNCRPNEQSLARTPVIAFAHQGGSFEGPSSTLAAIIARSPRVRTGIELDVHATADRQLVVCHDDTVDRTTNHHGR